MRNKVFDILKKSIIEVLPDLLKQDISPACSLREMGANSVDRAEIIVLTMSHLNLKIPMVNFAHAKNIGELVDIFSHHLTTRELQT